MLEEVDFEKWDPENSGDGITFLRFAKDNTYRLRPIGNALQFFKFFIGKGRPSLIVGKNEKAAAAQMLSEHSGTEMRPSARFAMFVIDRADNRIKILEGGKTIMDAFAGWSKPMKTKIGSGQGVDWNIKVDGDGMNRKYVATPLNATVFTEEERKTLSSLKEEKKLMLTNYLKETPLSDLLEKAFGDGSGNPASAPVSQPAAAAAAASASVAVASTADDTSW